MYISHRPLSNNKSFVFHGISDKDKVKPIYCIYIAFTARVSYHLLIFNVFTLTTSLWDWGILLFPHYKRTTEAQRAKKCLTRGHTESLWQTTELNLNLSRSKIATSFLNCFSSLCGYFALHQATHFITQASAQLSWSSQPPTKTAQRFKHSLSQSSDLTSAFFTVCFLKTMEDVTQGLCKRDSKTITLYFRYHKKCTDLNIKRLPGSIPLPC